MSAVTDAASSEKATCSVTFGVRGMTCAACVGRVERTLQKVPGVSAAAVNLATEQATLQLQTPLDPALKSELERALTRGGYTAEFHAEPLDEAEDDTPDLQANPNPSVPDETQTLRGQLVLALPLSALVMAIAMTPGFHGPLSATLQVLLSAFVAFFMGRKFFQVTLHGLRDGSAGMDTLIALGAGAPWIFSLWSLWRWGPHEHGHLYFETSAMIVSLALLGRWLERRARRGAGEALRALAALQPSTARRIRSDGTEEDVRVERLRVGQRVRVHAHGKIPVDGVVLEGSSELDEALFTGEPLPVLRAPGSRVLAGSVNGNGGLVVQVSSRTKDSRLVQIVKLVEQAQGSKAPIQRLVDRVSAVFVPAVMVLSLLAGLVRFTIYQQSFENSLLLAITVLVIACPCALGLATPTAIMTATTRAARAGLLLRDALSLEQATKVRTVIFDKTGTLTLGQPRLEAFVPLGNTSSEEALQRAASLDKDVQHPLARALVAEAKNAKLSLLGVDSLRVVPGRGVTGTISGDALKLGSTHWCPPAFLPRILPHLEAPAHRASTPILLLRNEEPVALFFFADQLKPEAPSVLAALRARGLELRLLSGDRSASCEAIASQLDLPAAWVLAERSPEEKLQELQKLQQTRGAVAMVGDGVNDGPALAAAELGIALGSGAELASAAASVTLLHHSLQALLQLFELSEHSLRTIRQNLAWALGYNLLALPLAASGALQHLGGPMLAAGAMALSSVSVVLNSLRLLGVRLSELSPRAAARHP